MSYLEGVDYWVRLVEFPSRASAAVTVSNGDGTFTIYINTRFDEAAREAGLRHELEHLKNEHFYRDEYGVCELEAAAEGLYTLREKPAAERRTIRLYAGPGAVLEDFLRRRRRRRSCCSDGRGLKKSADDARILGWRI